MMTPETNEPADPTRGHPATVRVNPHMRLVWTTCHGAKSPFAHTRTCDTRQIAAQPTEPTPQITGRACHDIHNTTDQPQTSPITPPNHRSRMPRHTQPGKSCINCSPQLPHCTRPTNRTAHTSHLVCRRIHHRSEVLSQKLVHEIPFPCGVLKGFTA